MRKIMVALLVAALSASCAMNKFAYEPRPGEALLIGFVEYYGSGITDFHGIEQNGEFAGGIDVELTRLSDSTKFMAITNSEGEFLFKDLQPGLYTLSYFAFKAYSTTSSAWREIRKPANISIPIAGPGIHNIGGISWLAEGAGEGKTRSKLVRKLGSVEYEQGFRLRYPESPLVEAPWVDLDVWNGGKEGLGH